jgi:hypothetical protein
VVGVSAEPPSRHTNQTNSVTGGTGPDTAESESACPTPAERAEEFREEYEHLAHLPLTEQPGQSIRASLTEETRREVTVPLPAEESTTTVHELERRDALHWVEAVEQLLESHEETKDTTLKLAKVREDDPEREVYYKPAVNSWMTEYQKRYFAELKGWVREAIGGERPSGGSTDGEFDDPYVVLVTRTASAAPDGERLPPVDHAEPIHEAWEPVYQTIRNRLRALGFSSDEWDYYRKEEPHTSERGGGVNTCYTHEHTFLIVDGEVSAEDFQPVLDKHVEECDPAGPEAHQAVEAVEVTPAEEVEDVAAYVASYTGIQPRDLSERSTEYIAWAATQWAANRNRRTRSNAAGWAATADACKQRYESDKSEQEDNHGECVVMSDRRGADFECAECGSPWGINQDHDTLTSARLSADDDGGATVATDGGHHLPDRQGKLEERWPSATAGSTLGRAPDEQKKVNLIERHLEQNPEASVSAVLGATMPVVTPEDDDLVREVMAGLDRSEPMSFERDPEWELEAIVVDDEEHTVSESGGVEMAEVVLPVKRLLKETRLKHVNEEQTPMILVHSVDGDAEYVASHDPELQARRLVEMGLTEPWAVELHLEFERRHHNRELAACFEEPERKPPGELGPK